MSREDGDALACVELFWREGSCFHLIKMRNAKIFTNYLNGMIQIKEHQAKLKHISLSCQSGE